MATSKVAISMDQKTLDRLDLLVKSHNCPRKAWKWGSMNGRNTERLIPPSGLAKIII